MTGGDDDAAEPALLGRILPVSDRLIRSLHDGFTELTRLRAEHERASAENRAAAGGAAQIAKRSDRRAASWIRSLDFAYGLAPGFTDAGMSRGQSRPAPADPAELQARYRELIEATGPQVNLLTKRIETWKQMGLLRRLFRRSAKPELPSKDLCDDLATLVAWAQEMSAFQQAAYEADIAEQGRVIHDKFEADQERILRESRDQQTSLIAELRTLAHACGMTLAGWDDPRWQSVPTTHSAGAELRLGRLLLDIPDSVLDFELPASVRFPFSAGITIDSDTPVRSSAVAVARALCLRLLAAVPPGQLRFTFIDPVSLGQSVAEFQHLADFDPELVGVRPITTARDIEARMNDLSVHIETVISKYLRGQFDSIDAYNQVAGEVAEPYRLLVIFDYPAGFTDAAAEQLLSLIENGPRCGLHTILLTDSAREQPRDLPLHRIRHSMQRMRWLGEEAHLTLAEPVGEVRYPVLLDQAPPISFSPDGAPLSPAANLLVSVGEGSRSAGNETVTLDRVLPVLNRMIATGRSNSVPRLPDGSRVTDDPQTWWTADTADSAVALLGRSGAQDLASLYFSSTEIAGGAIMVGLPRSGKTTSLHSAILTMCMMYGPDELELYLIDAKHGVEFKIYENLPHATMVSIHSEREFCVAVLTSLDQEIARRADLMKAGTAGRANLSEYRAATGERLPRIVLVMDEFHEIFEEDDQLGHAAFQAFSNIVRQGPFAGVHVVASSQTLSSMPALDRSTLQLLPERVAFMCNELDADLVMGDGNRGPRLLTRQGQGLFNPLRGEPSANKPFQGLYIPVDERNRILQQFAELSATRGFARQPRVFDGDAAASRPPVETVANSNRPRIRLGEPFSLQPDISVTLRRSRGSNLLLIGDVDEETGTDLSLRGALHSCIRDSRAAGAEVHVIDFIGDEALNGALSVADVSAAARAYYGRARQLAGVLAEIDEVVAKRLSSADYAADTRLLVLFGLQRALNLNPVDPYGDGPGREVAEQLERVLRDGPEVGVHTVLSVDSLGNLERRIGPNSFGEFGLRLGGSASTVADLQFITGSYGTTPQVRRNQLLLGDLQRGKETRMRAYPPLTRAEIAVELP